MIKKIIVFLTITIVSSFLLSCAAYERSRPIEVKKQPKPIRIGITPQTPPYVFKLEDKTVGIEPDFAKELVKKFGKPAQFIEMPWERLIPSLMDGKIDVIMSGMSITKARKLQVRFTTPYMTNGLMTLMRTADKKLYDTPEKIYNTSRSIGVVAGTTADVFVRRKCPKALVATFLRTEDAVQALKRQEIMLFIDDGPIVAWAFSQNSTEFSALFVPLTEEYTAWAVRPDNEKMLKLLNGALADWAKDGTTRRILKKWLPYIK